MCYISCYLDILQGSSILNNILHTSGEQGLAPIYSHMFKCEFHWQVINTVTKLPKTKSSRIMSKCSIKNNSWNTHDFYQTCMCIIEYHVQTSVNIFAVTLIPYITENTFNLLALSSGACLCDVSFVVVVQCSLTDIHTYASVSYFRRQKQHQTSAHLYWRTLKLLTPCGVEHWTKRVQ